MTKIRKRSAPNLTEKRRILMTVLGVFLLMLPLNLLTVMVLDDFSYVKSFADGQYIHSFGDIFRSLRAHYATMNGRLVPHFFAQLFLWLPHVIYKILNAGMFALFGYVIYLHGNYGRKESVGTLMLIYLLLWYMTPDFGESILWMDGSCNYLWGTFLLVLFLLPYRMYYTNHELFKKKIWIPVMFLLGALAGDCSENASAAVCGGAVLMLLVFAFRDKKVPGWAIAGTVGIILGFLFLLAAPANSVRLSSFGADGAQPVSLLNFYNSIETAVRTIPQIASTIGLVVCGVIYFYLVFRDKSVHKVIMPTVYLLVFFASVVATAAAPYFPQRAWMGGLAFFLIAFVTLLRELDFSRKLNVCHAVIACMCCFFLFSYVDVLAANAVVRRAVQIREAVIAEAAEQGEKDLILSPISNDNGHCAWMDIMTDPTHWYNAHYAAWYGLDSVAVSR